MVTQEPLAKIVVQFWNIIKNINLHTLVLDLSITPRGILRCMKNEIINEIHIQCQLRIGNWKFE